MSAPFGMPWLTFFSLVVIALSIVVAVVWAARSSGGEGKHE